MRGSLAATLSGSAEKFRVHGWSAPAGYFDEPTHLWLFDSSDGDTVYDQNPTSPLNFLLNAGHDMVYVGSGSNRALDTNNVFALSINTVDTTNDYLKFTNYTFNTGKPVEFTTTGALPGGLSASTTYYLRDQGSGNVTVHETLADAQNNASKVDLTSIGSGTNKAVGTNDNNVFVASSNLHHSDDAYTVYIWCKFKRFNELRQLFSKETIGSSSVYPMRLRQGHARRWESRHTEDPSTAVFHSNVWIPGLALLYPDGENKGVDYRNKITLSYLDNTGNRIYPQITENYVYLLVFGVDRAQNLFHIGLARSDWTNGFDEYQADYGLAIEGNDGHPYLQRQYSGLVPRNPSSGNIALTKLCSTIASASEIMDVQYNKIIYYDSLMSFEHHKKVFSAGLGKNSYFV